MSVSISSNAPMPDLLARAPSAELSALAGAAPVPDGFVGRVGMLVSVTDDARVVAQYAFEPCTQTATDYRDVRAAELWPLMAAGEIPPVKLKDGRGDTFTLEDFFEALFLEYPDRPWDQGGKALERRKARWRRAVVDALDSPSVTLLKAFNELPPDGRGQLTGLCEFWKGPSPAHEMRFDGTFYSPRASTKYLLIRLLDGHNVLESTPRCDPLAVPDIPVLFEDDALIVINKPSRLASVPGVREIVSAKSILEETHGSLRVVHRLDMDTSGVMVFAKTARAEKTLHESFRDGTVMKRYEARLDGELTGPQSRRVDLPLALNLTDRPRHCVLTEKDGGKVSVSDVEILRYETMPDGRKTTHVSLYPETGRTHQLRIHCAHVQGLGLPIDGDPFYGRLGLKAEDPAYRLCLHAAMLTLPHPQTGEIMLFEAPADFPVF